MFMLLLSCNGEPSDDESVHETCWEGYNDPAASVGSVEAGATLAPSDPFVPFEDPPSVQVFQGIQGGHHVFLTAQIDGLNPGDPASSDAKSVNPRTLFTFYRASGEKLSVNACPSLRAYETGEDAKYQLGGFRVLLDEKFIPDVYGQEVRLVVEVLDCDGLYAYHERWVTVLAPE
jgi:hypothetical protein